VINILISVLIGVIGVIAIFTLFVAVGMAVMGFIETMIDKGV